MERARKRNQGEKRKREERMRTKKQVTSGAAAAVKQYVSRVWHEWLQGDDGKVVAENASGTG